MIYRGDKTTYGQTIGILMMDSAFPRIPGDIGNATTFSFPVRYEIIRGAHIENVVETQDPQVLERFLEGARALEREGVRAITGSCGFLAIWQQEIARAVKVPVFMSALLQIPFAHAVTGGKKVGVITAQAQNLTSRHLQAVKADGIPVAIVGMDPAPEFHRVFTHGAETLEFDTAEEELLTVARRLVAENPDIGSIVLECSNIPPYAKKVWEEFRLPVFDLITMVNYVHSAVVKPYYNGYL